MFHHAQELCQTVDGALAQVGFQTTGGSYIQRGYEGWLSGRRARAELSVLTASQLIPSGYVLTIEVQSGICARWTAGREVPLLLRLAQSPVGAIEGAPLRAHDPAWARRFVDDPGLQAALSVLLREISYLEHLPTGELRIRFMRATRPFVPALGPLLQAFDVVLRATLTPPAPAPAPAHWTDRRGLLFALLAALVLGVFAGLWLLLIRGL